jgi:hypothetical protein
MTTFKTGLKTGLAVLSACLLFASSGAFAGQCTKTCAATAHGCQQIEGKITGAGSLEAATAKCEAMLIEWSATSTEEVLHGHVHTSSYGDIDITMPNPHAAPHKDGEHH